MTPTAIGAMEKELDRLISIQDRAVGIDLKRTNFKIAELQKRIDYAKACIPPMNERSAPSTFDCDHQPRGSKPD